MHWQHPCICTWNCSELLATILCRSAVRTLLLWGRKFDSFWGPVVTCFTTLLGWFEIYIQRNFNNLHFFFLQQLEGVKLVKVVDKLLYNDRVETRVGEEKPLEDVNARLQQCLHLPIKFRFKLGFVEKEIITEKGMPEWCVNIQRAIVNHMYLPIQDNNEKYQTRENEVWKTDVN